LPQIEADLARDVTDKLLVKLLLPIAGVTMVIGAPLGGFLVDRLGVRWVMTASCLLFTLGGTAGLYLSGLAALLASRLLVGLTAAGIATMSLIVINRRLDGLKRAKWIGLHVSISLFGTLFIHPVVGFLGQMGWRYPFLLYFFGLLLAPVAMIGLSSERRTAITRQAEAPVAFASWFPVRFIPLAFVIGSITYLPMVYMPFVARDLGVKSPLTISMILLADSLLASVFSMLYGFSRRYLSTNVTFLFSFVCTGMGMLVVSLAADLTGVILGMVIYGFGLGWFVPNLLTSATSRIETAYQGRAIGIIKGAHYLAAPTIILIVEPLTRAVGAKGAMWLAGLFAVVGLGTVVSRVIMVRKVLAHRAGAL
jgi:MFS family permease